MSVFQALHNVLYGRLHILWGHVVKQPFLQPIQLCYLQHKTDVSV